MVSHTEIEGITDAHILQLSEHARAEFLEAPDHKWTLSHTHRMWEVCDGDNLLLVAGLLRRSFVSVPEIWFVACEGLKNNVRANLREFWGLLGELKMMYPNITARVNVSYAEGIKFARFFGARNPRLIGSSAGDLYWRFEL